MRVVVQQLAFDYFSNQIESECECVRVTEEQAVGLDCYVLLHLWTETLPQEVNSVGVSNPDAVRNQERIEREGERDFFIYIYIYIK